MKTILAIVLCLIINFPLIANDNPIINSLEEAKILSRLEERPILLIFGNDNCRYCNLLKNDILLGTLSPLIDKYIICYIDIDISTQLKKQYDVNVIPDSRILNTQYKCIAVKKGYSKKEYTKWLENVK